MIVIIGAGLAGLSCSYHLGHSRCLVLEKSGRAFGLAASEIDQDFTWDQGPHVSFTKNRYVQNLFAQSVENEFDDYPVMVGNYFQGHWIDHPAQTSLHQVPEPLRTQCLDSFLATRSQAGQESAPVSNYMQLLERSFGPAFANTFPGAYARKFWTVDPRELTTDWIGPRIYMPSVQEVVDGSTASLPHPNYYIQRVRYPRKGGFQAFAEQLAVGCNLRLAAEVECIDLQRKEVWLSDGECIPYSVLINTMPLPEFIRACLQVPSPLLDAAAALSCTQLMLVDVCAQHRSMRPENWLYVYDEELVTTRFHFTEKLTPGNAPEGWTGVQAEVYFSDRKPLAMEAEDLKARVIEELMKMGIIDPALRRKGGPQGVRVRVRHVPFANIIYHHEVRSALESTWRWLEPFGLRRYGSDTDPLTDWDQSHSPTAGTACGGALFMAGRFGQWKYFWSDDCVLRGYEIARQLGLCPEDAY